MGIGVVIYFSFIKACDGQLFYVEIFLSWAVMGNYARIIFFFHHGLPWAIVLDQMGCDGQLF